MKKLLLLLCLSLPAFGQIINPTSGLPANYSVVDASSLSGVNLTLSGAALLTGSNYLGAGTPNEGTAGTTNGLGAKFVNTGGVVQAKVCATTDTAIPCWPTFAQRNTSTNAINGCTSGCLTGNAYLATTPGSTVAVTFDNTTVVGHYVVASTSAAGQYHDTGSATAPTSNWYLGRAQTAGTGTQTVSIEPQVAGGAGGGGGFAVQGNWTNASAGQNPLASTTYFIGYLNSLSTTDDNKNYVSVPFTGTIQGFCVKTRVTGTLASAGSASAVIRKNNTTDYGTTVTPVFTSASPSAACTTGSTMAVTQGDLITLKLVTPAWVTAPGGVLLDFSVYASVP